jgi:hypothetical protein
MVAPKEDIPLIKGKWGESRVAKKKEQHEHDKPK